MKINFLLTLFSLMFLCVKAQVGIGTKTADPSAALDVVSSNKGVLVSRMTERDRLAIKSPAVGLLVYQTDNGAAFYYYTGAEWKLIPSSSASGTGGTYPATNYVTGISGTTNRITSSGGSVPKIDIASNYLGQTSITTLGTITSGSWNAGVIPENKGGAGTINGLLKANGTGTVSAAVKGTDYAGPLTLTTTGTAGAATFNSNTGVLNIPQYSGGNSYTFSSPLNLTGTTISIPPAATSSNGYLTSVDWNNFNNKLSISTAASTYAPINSPIFTGNVGGITKFMVGLGNVDNTSDLNKPVSSATQSILDTKLSGNTAISGATKTKITFDSKGLVTSGTDATTSDVLEGTNQYFTAERVRNTVLTDYTIGANIAVANTDNLIGSIGKLQAQINSKQNQGQAWVLGGNSGVDPNTHFLGTIDNKDLVFKVNNLQSGRVSSTSENISIGVNSLKANTSGIGNTALGTSSLTSNTTGSNNVAAGINALYQNTGGIFNSAFGASALKSNTTGSYNVAIGQNALYDNTSGSGNIAIGQNSLKSNNGPGSNAEGNVAIGTNSMMNATSTRGNTALGLGTLSTMTYGNDNTAVGEGALWLLPYGYNNTALGSAAMLRAKADVSKSVAVGVRAGENISSSFNTFIGFESGAGTLGGGNVFLGSLSGFNPVFKDVHNKLVIQNNDSPNPLMVGEFDNKKLSINGSLLVSGNVPNSLTTAEPSAALEVKSTSQGLLLPRMTSSQRDNIINPAQGLVIYCTNCGVRGQMNVFDGVEWTDMIGGTVKQDINLSNGLVAFYPFTGNAGDSSGNGNHGTVTGAQLAVDRFGRGNNCYYFNGLTDWISIVAKTSLLPNNISISFWVKIPTNYSANDPIGRMIRSRFFGYYIQYDSLSHDISFQIHPDSDGIAGANISSTSGIKYNDNNWHFVTGTFDGIKINLYIDGTLKSSVSPRTSNIYYQSDGAILLGKDGNSSSPNAALFQGWLDDVRIYNRALNQSEITYLAAQ